MLRNTRQRVWRAVLCSAVAIATAAVAVQARAETIKLTVSHYLPPAHTIHKELTRWAEELATKSDGRLRVNVFPSGQMGPPPRQFDLARTGVADVAFFIHGALPGRFPVTEAAQLPYAFNRKVDGGSRALGIADASAILTDLAPLLEKEHEGTRILYALASPTIGLYMRKATVRKPADMAGLRLRHNGPITSAMVAAWGGSPVALPPSDLADAMDKGVLDGMVFNFEAAHAFQMAKSLHSVTDLKASAATFALVMNRAKYDSLPADLRRLIDETTGAAAARRVGALYDEAEAAGRRYLEDNKVTVIEPSAEEAAAFQTLAAPLADKLAGASGDRAVIRDFQAQLKARVEKGMP
ncbi:TRAP transporter substrate-binding protein [Azospirillum sp. RWY-5-1]|uniref:TRAP transporter substrate-binding protein n=1 Tax=Azospirillum oleiclasticum TaxID=2735135 RepID=A0ABX2TKI3_9PROT|nr:TRAP transporter substrate-binding protein [Azospirillum oleiclasticum]NYZ17492.1 TRAP transporter substrate-binding protein [Azospirillum oleiclasticum]NYZ24870.1 TRAP transporter substrate-binding protein [Azospirillum oleiclasticum]